MKNLVKYIKSKPLLYKICHKIYFGAMSLRRFLTRILKHQFFYFLLKPTTPLSDWYGLDRGQSICRYFIEKFLEENKVLIKGYCLEIRDDYYTKKFGGDKVKQSDILDVDTNIEKATIYGDLRNLNNIQDNTYDCIILTQVLQYIDDYISAVKECYRILKPEGALLVTVPAMSRIDCVAGIKGDFWRFTSTGAEYIFNKFFKKENLEIKSCGNVLVGVGYWIGLSREELSKKELDYNDRNFPCFVMIKAIKK